MRVALCDDESIYTDELKKIIENYAFEHNADITVDCFSSGLKLLECEKYDMYFLDFLMPEINGVDTAVKLKEKFSNTVTVCFLTSYEKAAIEIINRNVFAEAFLVKPVEEDKLYELLDRLYSRSFFTCMVLKKDSVSRVVYPQDIIYVEASRKTTVFRFFDGTEEFGYSFSDIGDNYLSRSLFFKVHRSYIVNLMHVESFTKNEVIMKNGDRVPMRREKEFRAAFSSFNMSYVR